MRGVNFIEAVAERDMDLLLLEEFHVSDEFCSWFISLVLPDGLAHTSFEGAWHSVTHPYLGESDLLVIVAGSPGGRVAPLIENKIDAPPQPGQGARYRERGQVGLKENEWDQFRTVIVAPARYLARTADTESYDSQIAYESIQEWFDSRGLQYRRERYKARLITEAIQQQRRGYSPQVHHEITEFWYQYWEYARTYFPDVEMERPGDKGPRSMWIPFQPGALGTGRLIYHKLDKGCVDLQIDGAGELVDVLNVNYSSLFGNKMVVVRTGKSASVRVAVPIVDPLKSFDEQKEQVSIALEAVRELARVSSSVKISDAHD